MNTCKKLMLLLPLIALSTSGCGTINNNSSNSNNNSSNSTPSVNPSEDPNANKKSKNFYQLLVYSFADSNNDGIGDFKGIVDKLDYLVDLGVEAIWLSPVNTCKDYHAYNVKDYYSINSAYEYGDYNFDYLITECHKKNISVVMDLVLNHTSSEHVWTSQHPDWYSNKDVFGYGMRDLDYDKQAVKDEMKNVGRYWLNKGVDGFRLDAAMWLYNASGGTGSSVDHNKNYAYWNEWCAAMRQTNPDCYIIGEVLNSNHDLAYEYARAGFNSTFDFNVRRNVYSAVNGSTNYVDNTITDMNKALSINQNYILGRVLSNHDIGRYSQPHNGMGDEPAYYFTDFSSLRLANALNIMMRGNTFIYYGDELGLKGECKEGWDDMAFRTPMPFGTERTNSVTYFQGFKGNGQTTSTTLSGQTAEQDQTNQNSLYASVKALLNIKKNSDAIKNGTVSKLTNLPTGLQGYTLSNSTKTVSFIYNPTNSPVSYQNTQNILYSTDGNTNNISISSKGFIVTSN